MNDYEKFIYVVYFHVDPVENNKVMYVGMGKRERPWAMSNSGGESPSYGKRSKPHYEWYLSLENRGFLLQDIVQISHRNLTKAEALKLERRLIKRLKPVFNKPMGKGITKITQEIYDRAATLHGQGVPLSQISSLVGLASMTIQRAFVGKSESIPNCWYTYVPNKATYRWRTSNE